MKIIFYFPFVIREFNLEVQQKYREYRTERVATPSDKCAAASTLQQYKHSITVPEALATALSQSNPWRI